MLSFHVNSIRHSSFSIALAAVISYSIGSIFQAFGFEDVSIFSKIIFVPIFLLIFIVPYITHGNQLSSPVIGFDTRVDIGLMVGAVISILIFFGLNRGYLQFAALVSVSTILLIFTYGIYNVRSFFEAEIIIARKKYDRYSKYINYILFPILIALSVVPWLTPKYIGSETLLNNAMIDDIIKRGRLESFQITRVFTDEVSARQIIDQYTAYSRKNKSIDMVVIKDNSISASFGKKYLDPLCVFALNPNDSYISHDILTECENSVRGREVNEILNIANLKIPNDIKESVFSIGNAILATSKNSKEERLVEVTTQREVINAQVKGGYAHHYFSALSAVFMTDPLSANQYGIGPGLIVRLVKGLLNVEPETGLDISIIFTNILIAFWLLLLLSKIGKYAWILLIGFILSLSSVVFSSGTMAPMLFPFRVLPYIIVTLIILSFALNSSFRKAIDLNKIGYFCFYTAIVVCGLWDRTYGFLFFLAFVFTYIYSRVSIYGIASILLLATMLTVSLILALIGGVQGGSGDRESLFAYIFSPGLNGIGNISMPVIVILIIGIFLLISIFGINGLKRNSAKNLDCLQNSMSFAAQVFFACLSLLFLVKPIWNGSENHIGIVYFTLSISIFCLASDRFGKMPYFSLLIIPLVIVGFLKPLPNMLIVNYNNYLSLKINQSLKSTFGPANWYVSPNFAEYLKKFDELYQFGDFVVSPSDNALSLHVKRILTPQYIDLSTNLYNDERLSIVLSDIVTMPKRRVLIDKAIFVKSQSSDYTKLVSMSPLVATASAFRESSVLQFQRLHDLLLNAGYTIEDENSEFLVLSLTAN